MVPHKQFWDELLAEDVAAIRQEYEELWAAAGAGGEITKAQAERTLDLMFKRTHLDIKDHGLQDVYPTVQGGPRDKLAKVEHLWWVDHATAGVSGWGTVGWFSSALRTHTRSFSTETEARSFYGAKRNGAQVTEKNGKWTVTWKGLAEAVTHFVSFIDGTPMYLVPIKDCCWGEPKKNRDGIHIETINPLVCSLRGKEWRFWAGPIPQEVLKQGLHPVALDKPFRGAHHMMPYTWQQVIANIKLKRLCVAATGRMSRDRMSHHTDWRDSKYDMGPLWPRKMIDDAAFEQLPLAEYDFMKTFVDAAGMDNIVDPIELKSIEDGSYEVYDQDEQSSMDTDIDSSVEIQEALIKLYGARALPQYGADGDLGPETCGAVKRFQRDWNKNKPYDQIAVNGVPDAQTCARLEEALVAENFRTTAID